jgi:eukaryotic-like serine/threonine-protein kinase
MVRPHSRVTSLAVSGCLLVLLAACGPFGSATSAPTPTASTGGRIATATTGHATSTPTTAPMPATQTACPPAGTARAAVFAPLALGPHQNIVYVFNQGTSSNSWSGELKRYDTSTGQKVIIVNAPTSQIFGAQISADGKWILFTTSVSSAETALQLVRMDGQGLQTLYCSANGIGDIQWSPDQKTVVFMDGLRLVMEGLGSPTVYSLDLATGHLQVELVEPTAAGSFGAAPAAWLDDTHLYMTSFFIGGVDFPLPQSLSVLDTAKGAQQQLSDLLKVFASSGPCLSFDSSVEHAKLFVSTCHLLFGDGPTPRTQQGPSAIISEPALGGPQTAVYSTPALAITTLRVISSTTLLLLIQNLSGDTSHNGLWKMNLDGTGLARLTTAGTGQMSWLNGSQFPWSNVSRDGSRYALEISSNNGTTQSLLIGSLAGTSPSTFATVSSTVDNVAIVGWTTL